MHNARRFGGSRTGSNQATGTGRFGGSPPYRANREPEPVRVTELRGETIEPNRAPISRNAAPLSSVAVTSDSLTDLVSNDERCLELANAAFTSLRLQLTVRGGSDSRATSATYHRRTAFDHGLLARGLVLSSGFTAAREAS